MRTRLWLKRIFLGLTVLLLTACLGVLWLLGTESGRLWLTRQGQTMAAEAGIQLDVDNLRSPALGEWRADRILLQRHSEPMLELREFALLWQPSALLQRRLQIDRLTAIRVDYYHLHHEATPKQSEASGGIPQSPVTLALQQFQITTLALHNLPGINGRTLPEYRVHGAAEAFGDRYPLQLQLDLRSLESNETTVQIDTQATSEKEVFFQGSIAEEPGGLLGSLLQWPTQDRLEVEFRLGLEQDENHLRVAVEELQAPVAGHRLGIQGTLEYSPDKETLEVSEMVVMIDGKRQLLRGGYSSVDLWAQLDLNNLPLDLVTPWYGDIQGGSATGTVEVSWLHHDTGRWPSLTADLEATAQYRQQTYALDIRGGLEQKLLSLEPSRLQVDNTTLEVQGALDLESDKSDLRGTLAGFHTDLLKPWPVPVPEGLSVGTDLARFHLRGAVRDPDISLASDINGVYRQQKFQLTVDGRSSLTKAQFKDLHLTLGSSELTAAGTLDWTGSSTSLTASFTNLNRDLLQLAPESAAAKVPEGLTFIANGKVQIAGPLRRPKIQTQSRISGTFELPSEQLPYVLELHGSLDAGGLADLLINAEQVQLSLFDSPTLTLKGHYSAQAMDLSLQMTRLPAQALAALGWRRINGESEADLKLTGTLKKPRIEGYVVYRDQLRGRSKRRVPLEMRVDLATEQELLQLAATMKHDQAAAGNLNLTLPLGLYLQSQGKAVPLDITANGEWDLTFIRLFTDLGPHRVEGKALANFHVTGTLNEPVLRGQLRLENGTYSNLVTGTQLEEIRFTLEGEGQNLVIREARAQSGDEGELQLSGNIYWQQDRRLQPDAIDLTLKAKDAMLIQRRDVQGEVQGELKVSGSFKEIWLKGELEISPLNANIDSAVKTRIPEIKVTEVKDEGEEETANASNLPVVHLDVTLVASQQAYLRGRGLDTELTGRIALEGTLSEPQYRGQFNTRRGRIDLFGKRFVLENGEVRFNNAGAILRIPAVHKASDIEIRAEVYGTAEEPKLALSSVPALPNDEILSRLIFGKSVQEISAFEAIRLAGAVRSLTSGGGFDPVDSARALLGVDTLTIDSTANEDSGRSDYTVGVGKYLNERVYLELGRSSNPAQPWSGSVEIELTPKITLESRTTEKGGAGAELMWKRDY